jgi:hypothetical protein
VEESTKEHHKNSSSSSYGKLFFQINENKYKYYLLEALLRVPPFQLQHPVLKVGI